MNWYQIKMNFGVDGIPDVKKMRAVDSIELAEALKPFFSLLGLDALALDDMAIASHQGRQMPSLKGSLMSTSTICLSCNGTKCQGHLGPSGCVTDKPCPACGNACSYCKGTGKAI